MIPRDITGSLRQSELDSSSWSPSRARETLERLRAAFGEARLDWDEGAGEDWGRILVEQRAVVLVSMLVPLALVCGTVPAPVLAMLELEKVTALVSQRCDQREFASDLETLKRVFRRTEWSEAVDPHCFSANELWWVTV